MSNIPYSSNQNPSSNPTKEGQEYLTRKQQLVTDILKAFRTVLPSNYVALTNGPFYSLQFQAMAEQLATLQLSTTEVYKDSNWDFTRPDFLWQVLGSLVFPGNDSGIPQIDGDIEYREFLKSMVLNLLKGATKSSLVGGANSLDENVIVTIVERYLSTAPRNPNGGYTIEDQFFIDVFAEGFSQDPFGFQENLEKVLSALKPAHVLYGFSFLFQDAFGTIANDTGGLSLDLESYYYDDMRKWCIGAERIFSTCDVLPQRNIISDPSVSFESIRKGSIFTITEGINKGSYKVLQQVFFLQGLDSTPRAYNLSSGGSGTLYVLDDKTLHDPSRDWGLLGVDEVLTILSGPNAGKYRISRVLGSTGGFLGDPGISGSYARIAPSHLKLSTRIPFEETGVEYKVEVDRLGVQTPRVVTGEVVTTQFIE